jgi:acyl dehydratase
MTTDDQLEAYRFRYTRKDLILYALSIGMGFADTAEATEDLRFLYERHPQFSAFPTFCLTCMFWSDNNNRDRNDSGRIPPFPPPLMAKEEVLPRKFLKHEIDLSSYPLIHMWQSIVWNRNLPVPTDPDTTVETSINSKMISVQPKSVGTFVTTQSQVTTVDPLTNHKSLLCFLQTTTLVLGISRDAVEGYDSGIAKQTSTPVIENEDPPLFEWTYPTRSNQALLFRIASGDSNRIHVDTSASEMMGSDKKAPLLHGLFSLAVAFRAILKFVPDADQRIRRLEARFAQPALVGDVLSVKIWKSKVSSSQLLFVVVNKETGVTLVDCGCAEIQHDGFAGTAETRISRL